MGKLRYTIYRVSYIKTRRIEKFFFFESWRLIFEVKSLFWGPETIPVDRHDIWYCPYSSVDFEHQWKENYFNALIL